VVGEKRKEGKKARRPGIGDFNAVSGLFLHTPFVTGQRPPATGHFLLAF